MKALSYRLLIHAHLLAGEIKGQVMVLCLDENGAFGKLRSMIKGLDFVTTIVTKSNGKISVSGFNEVSFDSRLDESIDVALQIKEAVSFGLSSRQLLPNRPVIVLAVSDDPGRIDTLQVLSAETVAAAAKK